MIKKSSQERYKVLGKIMCIRKYKRGIDRVNKKNFRFDKFTIINKEVE